MGPAVSPFGPAAQRGSRRVRIAREGPVNERHGIRLRSYRIANGSGERTEHCNHAHSMLRQPTLFEISGLDNEWKRAMLQAYKYFCLGFLRSVVTLRAWRGCVPRYRCMDFYWLKGFQETVTNPGSRQNLVDWRNGT